MNNAHNYTNERELLKVDGLDTLLREFLLRIREKFPEKKYSSKVRDINYVLNTTMERISVLHPEVGKLLVWSPESAEAKAKTEYRISQNALPPGPISDFWEGFYYLVGTVVAFRKTLEAPPPDTEYGLDKLTVLWFDRNSKIIMCLKACVNYSTRSYPTLDRAGRLTVFPDGSDAALMIGTVLPPDPTRTGIILLTSPVTELEFDDEDRGVLEALAKLNSWPSAVGVLRSIGGDESDLDDLVHTGLIRRLPGRITTHQFLGTFRDLALVSVTACAASEITDDYVMLASPSGDPVSVSLLLYAVLLNSPGNRPLPDVLTEICQGDQDAVEMLSEEIITLLCVLINSDIAAVVYAR